MLAVASAASSGIFLSLTVTSTVVVPFGCAVTVVESTEVVTSKYSLLAGVIDFLEI